MKLSAVIHRCAWMEHQISEVYETFAKRWPEPPLGDFWWELARDEICHGMMLQDAAKLPSADRDDPTIDPAKLTAIGEYLDSRFPLDRLTLDQAFDLVLDLEDLELENIYRRLLATTLDDSRMTHAFRTALGQTAHHEEKILNMIDARSKDRRLLEKAAERRRRALRSPVRHADAR